MPELSIIVIEVRKGMSFMRTLTQESQALQTRDFLMLWSLGVHAKQAAFLN